MILLFLSCKKESTNTPSTTNTPRIEYLDECEDIPPFEGLGWGYNYISESVGYYNITRNPYNEEEIFYFKYNQNIENNNNQIIKYNFSTKQETVIYHDNPISYCSSPNEKGWILFNMNFGDIYKIKTNGDSLTLIKQNNCYNPIWIGNNKIIYSTETIPYIINEQGNILDSIPNTYPETFSIKNNNLLLTHDNKIILYKLDTKEITDIILGNIIFRADWIDNEKFVWCDRDAIYKTNINTQETDTIKQVCNSTLHESCIYSSFLNKYVFSVELHNKTDSITINRRYILTIMDINGDNEYVFK